MSASLWSYVVVNEYGGIIPETEAASEVDCLARFAALHPEAEPANLGCVVVRVTPVAVSGYLGHKLFTEK